MRNKIIDWEMYWVFRSHVNSRIENRSILAEQVKEIRKFSRSAAKAFLYHICWLGSYPVKMKGY